MMEGRAPLRSQTVPLPEGERDRLALASQGEGRAKNAGDLLARARAARQEMTVAEERLWSRLRNRQLGGFKFRRQHPLGRARPDFLCVAAGLIVEVDGSQHADMQSADERRTEFLNAQGYRVLRFWNNDVMARTDQVLEAILSALTAPHPGSLRSPVPLPQAVEGR